VKKYLLIVSLLTIWSNCLYSASITLSNDSGKTIEYRIKKSKKWNTLANKKEASLKAPIWKKVIIEWRDKDHIYESHELRKPSHFTFGINGRYTIVQEDPSDKKQKPVDDLYLYAYKRIPEYLDKKTRKKYLLPLKKLEKSIDAIKASIKYLTEKIKNCERLAKHYEDTLKRKQKTETIKALKEEKKNIEKRAKAYKKLKSEHEKLEKELLIREIIEKYKEKLNKKGENKNTKMYKDSIEQHKKMFKELTKWKLPKKYLK